LQSTTDGRSPQPCNTGKPPSTSGQQLLSAAHAAGGTDRDLTHADMLDLAANARESWAANLEAAQ
jgi:hypothetical protein